MTAVETVNTLPGPTVNLPGLNSKGELPSSVANGSAIGAGYNGLVWTGSAWEEAHLDSLKAAQAGDTGASSAVGSFVSAPAWGSGHTFRNSGAYQDGIFFVDGFTDASGKESEPLTYTKLFGGSATKTGPGNFDAHWASVVNKGTGEAGLFIGDVTGHAEGKGGHLWGGHFRITDNWASGGSYIRGLLLEVVPNVKNEQASIGFQVLNNGDESATITTTSGSEKIKVTAGVLKNGQFVLAAGVPNGTSVISGGETSEPTLSAKATASASGVAAVTQWQLNQGVRVAGNWGKAFIVYSDAAGTKDSFDIDRFGNTRVGGSLTPLTSSTVTLGSASFKWQSLFLSTQVNMGGAGTANTAPNIGLTDANSETASTPSPSGIFIYSFGGALKIKQTTPATLAANATNLATTETLVNDIKAKLKTMGLFA